MKSCRTSSQEHDLTKAGTRAKPAGEQVTGDPDQAFKDADVIVEGEYGTPVITHCCLETHGTIVQWNGDHVEVLAVHAKRFRHRRRTRQSDQSSRDLRSTSTWITSAADSAASSPSICGTSEAAHLSKASGGKPVKMFLDRETELTDRRHSPLRLREDQARREKGRHVHRVGIQDVGLRRIPGGGSLNADLFPYVYRKVPNRRMNHMGVSINAGTARAWRAPNHPQVSLISCSALDDLAAKCGMDSLQFFLKNADLTD